jgi:terminase small subunit-like protein
MSAKKLEKKRHLTDKHKLFIDAYMETLNATRAYMQVYPKASYETARRAASALMTSHDIREVIAERFKARAMGSEEIIARLSDMASGTHWPFIEIDSDGFVYFDFSSSEAKNHLHLIKKIKSKRERRISGKGEDAQEWEGEWVEVELHDSKDALIQLAKYNKLFDPETGDEGKFTAPQIVEIIKTYEKNKDE